MTCNWEFLDPKNNEHCTRVEYGSGYCKTHFFKVFRRTAKKCQRCDNDVDNFGDGYCRDCGILVGTRAICIVEGCESAVWSKKVKTEYCEGHDPKRKCRQKGCKSPATKDNFGFRYCMRHYPERNICKYIKKGTRCRGRWYSDIDHGDMGFCHKHNKSGIDNYVLNSVTRRTRKYSGRCCKIFNTDKVTKCSLLAAKNTDYCYRHSKDNKH